VEVQAMVKCVTDHEYTLRRRQLIDSNFIKYIDYMISIESLREERFKAIQSPSEGIHRDNESRSSKIKLSIAEYRSIQVLMLRHVAYIYERYTRRFPSNLAAWFQYIAYLQQHNARALLNTVYGRFLSLHPKQDIVWIESARHELKYNSNSHTTRILLQRALRFNRSSEKLWLYYFEFEVWNATRITDRKRALDLDVDNTAVLGAPVVVLLHALEAIPDVSFALKFLKSSKEVSNILYQKIVEKLSERFVNSAELVKYLLLSDLEMEHVEQDVADSDLESRYTIHQPYGHKKLSSVDILEACKARLAQAISRLAVHANRDDLSENLELLRSLYEGIAACILRLAHDLSYIGSNTKNMSLPTRKQLSSSAENDQVSSLESNPTAADDLIVVWEEISGLLEQLADHWQRCIDASLIATAAWIIASSILSMSRLSSILRSMQSSLTSQLHIPITNHLSCSLSNCTEIGLLTSYIALCYEQMKAKAHHAATADLTTFSSSIVSIIHELQRQQHLDSSGTIELCKAYLQGYECILSADERGSRYLFFFIDKLIVYEDLLSARSYVHKIMRSDNCSAADLILLYQKHLHLHRLANSSNGDHSSIRTSYVHGYRELMNHLDKKPSILSKLSLKVHQAFDSVIAQEIVFRDAGLVTKEESYAFLKEVLETAIKLCSNHSEAIQRFYDAYENLERSMGNHKLANHLAWRRKQGV
jgi:hypothetical protein